MPPREGIGVYAHSLAQQLLELGHQPTLITRGEPGRLRGYEVAGVAVLELPFAPVYPVHVHVHGLFVRRYLRRNARQFDIVHAHSPLVPPISGPWPVVTTLHSLLAADARDTKVDDVRSLAIRLVTPITAQLERRLLRESDMIAIVNPLLQGAVEAEVEGRVPIRVLPNGVDVSRFSPGPGIRRVWTCSPLVDLSMERASRT